MELYVLHQPIELPEIISIYAFSPDKPGIFKLSSVAKTVLSLDYTIMKQV